MITSDGANVEHLLDILTFLDTDSNDVWDICATFLMYLYGHKHRTTVLWSGGSCIEISRSGEAFDIYARLGGTQEQAKCWNALAWLLYDGNQLDVAVSINLFLSQDMNFWICASHRLLGGIYQYKGGGGRAIQHYGAALVIASPFNWHNQLLWIHHSLALLCSNESRVDTAHVHVERAKWHAVDDPYSLCRATGLQAWIWGQQDQFEERKAEVLCV